MSEKPLLNYDTNKEQARLSIKHGRDALVIPVLREKEIVLHYHRGKLQPHELIEDKLIQQNRLPRNLRESGSKWGGFRIKDMYVKGWMLKTGLLVWQQVDMKEGTYHSFMQNLSLLHGQGFQTILPFSGWMDFASCKRSRHIERQLESRLETINAVAKGERASLWNPNRGSDRYHALKRVKNVQILDCIGFVPSVNDPHVRSVYKASR